MALKNIVISFFLFSTGGQQIEFVQKSNPEECYFSSGDVRGSSAVVTSGMRMPSNLATLQQQQQSCSSPLVCTGRNYDARFFQPPGSCSSNCNNRNMDIGGGNVYEPDNLARHLDKEFCTAGVLSHGDHDASPVSVSSCGSLKTPSVRNSSNDSSFSESRQQLGRQLGAMKDVALDASLDNSETRSVGGGPNVRQSRPYAPSHHQSDTNLNSVGVVMGDRPQARLHQSNRLVDRQDATSVSPATVDRNGLMTSQPLHSRSRSVENLSGGVRRTATQPDRGYQWAAVDIDIDAVPGATRKPATGIHDEERALPICSARLRPIRQKTRNAVVRPSCAWYDLALFV